MLRFLLLVSSAAAEWRTASVRCEDGAHPTALPRSFRCSAAASGADATGRFLDAMNTTGWARLHVRGIHKGSTLNDRLRLAFAAGYVEAALTAERTWQHWQNLFHDSYSNRTEYQKVKDFVVANDAFARSNINRSAASDEYWAEVAVLWAQLDGLVAGHAASCGELCIGLTEFLFLQAEQDLSSVQNIPSEWTYASAAAYTRETTHCSAIVKLAPNNSDLYMGHNTWTGYSSMLRVLKEYNLPLGGADQVAHSAYFGNLYSGDDFYVLSSGLTVQETTNSVYNKTSLEKIKPESLFTWARTVIANRKATDGASWVKWFSPFNSGTINNQWMIAEMHRFKANEDLPDRFFTVAEQMPGSIVWSDLTEVLRAQGFWVSYNSPFFPEIRVISGADDMEKRFGDAYSYTRNPRAKIFARDVRNATDMARVQHLLRYNDWQHDPLSAHGYGGPTEPNAPENAIAARYDLHPWASERKDFGNTDAKVCAAADCLRLRFSAISGPTAEDQPAFAWTGVPDVRRDRSAHRGRVGLWGALGASHPLQLQLGGL